MLVTALLLGVFMIYPGTMPLAACCSALIATACVSEGGEEGEEDLAKENLTREKLQWGVVGQVDMTGDSNLIGHACFSAKEVHPLITGQTYA